MNWSCLPLLQVAISLFGGGSFGTVETGPEAPIGVLATRSAAAGLALPIDDSDRFKSVLSYMFERKEAFPRSTSPPARLVDVVSSVQVTGSGSSYEMSGDVFRRYVSQSTAATLPFTVDTIQFRASKASSKRWLRSWMIAFEVDKVVALIDALSSASLGDVDLSMRAQSGAYGVSVVFIRALGDGAAAQQRVTRVVEGAISGARILKQIEADGAEAGDLWMALSPAQEIPSSLIDIIKVVSDAPRPLDDLKRTYANAARFLITMNPDGADPTPGIDSWMLLRLNAADGLADFEAHMLVNRLTAEMAQVDEGRRLLYDVAAVPVPVVAARGVTLERLDARKHGQGLIRGFSGHLFRANTSRYAEHVQQYATSSFDAAVRQQRMQPAMVVVPQSVDDIVAVVEYAAARNMKVVARSGGHQYCGLSSGGANTIVVSMEAFDTVDLDPAGVVKVGVGSVLYKLSGILVKAGRALPHGECPLVALGGHVQTGGVGHTLRTLGITLDYVVAFTMVTVGADGRASVKRYVRPASRDVDDDDARVFAAVLGGGPGSWGVVVSWELQTVSGPATGYSAFYLYNHVLQPNSKRAFVAALDQSRLWNELETQGKLGPGRDLMVSFISGQLLRPPILIVEAMATTPEGDAMIKDVAKAVNAVQRPLKKSIDGPTTLSEIMHHSVRDPVLTMSGGREFFHPFKKSLRCTKKAFSRAFVEKFVDLVDRAQATPHLDVVVQTVVGGGKFARPDHDTNFMQRRDTTFQLVFDVFYEEGNKDAEAKAIAYHAELRALLHMYSDDEERLFWGTFENAERGDRDLNMTDPVVQAMYYDSPEVYQTLQRIKMKVDPLNVFHTSFTVQPVTS